MSRNVTVQAYVFPTSGDVTMSGNEATSFFKNWLVGNGWGIVSFGASADPGDVSTMGGYMLSFVTQVEDIYQTADIRSAFTTQIQQTGNWHVYDIQVSDPGISSTPTTTTGGGTSSGNVDAVLQQQLDALKAAVAAANATKTGVPPTTGTGVAPSSTKPWYSSFTDPTSGKLSAVGIAILVVIGAVVVTSQKR